MKKRFLPVLLVMFIIAAMIPTFALADSSEMSGTEFLAREKNGVINMTGNVTLTSSAVIRGDLIIRLNGYSLSRDTSNSNSLGVLLLDISSGSVTIVGPGTITGGEYGRIRNIMPKGVVAVAGSASLTIKDGAVISGGKIGSNSTNRDFNTVNFSGSGTLTIENSTVTGLDYGDREAGTAVYVSGEAKVVVTDSTLTGGSSTSNAAGNALELRTSGEAAVITNSTLTGGASSQSRSGGDGLYISSDVSAVVNGGALTGGQGNSGGKGVNVSGSVTLTGVTVTGGASTNSTPGVGVHCTSPAKNVIITGCTVTGGSPAEGTTTNSAGRGMDIYGPVTLTVESSIIQGGNNNRTSGDPIGGNAIWFYNENSKGANITLTDTTLGVGNDPAGDAVITGNSNAPAGSGGLLANITARGTLTVDSGVMKNTTITPADDGLVIVAKNDATVAVGKNNLTVASKGTVESEGQTTYYPTATLAVRNAKPGGTVTIQELGKGESLESVPNGIILKNGTGETITVGGQEVEPGGVLADWVAKIGEEQYVSLETAIDAANKTAAGNEVVVEIIKSGDYNMFTITRANVTVQAAEGVTATFTVSGTKTGNVNGENVTLEGLNFVSDDGTTIFSSGNCDSLTLKGCTFKGDGTGTALYIHTPNITITGCTFENFERGYYTCGDNSSAGAMTFTDNTFTNVRVPIDGYWGEPATDNTDIKITRNTFNPGTWEAAYIQLWDYAQYQYWLNGSSSTLNPEGKSAIIATIEDNTYNGNVVIYATHFDWFSESNLTMDAASEALLQYRVLVELEGAESATVRNADGSEITAFNESKASSERGGKVVIYSLSVGDYIFDIVPAEGSDPVPKEVTLKAPLVEEETNKVTVDAAETAVAKVGDDEYKTLAEAIEAAKNGGTVELLRDVYVATWNQVWNTTGLTINGNGHTVTIGEVESNVNGNYLFYNADNLKVNDLTFKFLTNGNGFVMTSGELKNVKMYGGESSNYAVFVANGGTDKTVTVTGCTIEDFGIAVYSQSGTAATSNIKVTGSDIKDCGIAICSYAQSNVFTGNTVTNASELSFAGGENAVTTVTGNSFNNAGKIWFYNADLSNVTFENNKVLGNTYVTTDEAMADTTLDVDRNYWGGGAPDETQVVGENVSGKDVYYVAPGMNESDLNTYAPYTVILIFGNGMGNDVKNYKPNAQFKLPVPSKPGYIFMGWKCSDGHTHEAGETITVTKSLTFTAIWSNLPDIEPGTPDVKPDEPDVSDFPFTDVSVNAWYYEAVKYVYENGIMNGMDRYSFQPNGTLTRAMVWTMLARLDGVDTEGGANWYAKAQEWATATGVSDGENPTGEVTREQLVTMLWRYAGSPTYTADLSGYVDTADISSWAEQAMCWAVATGVIEGDENSALTPKASTTRAQAAAMLMRFIEL